MKELFFFAFSLILYSNFAFTQSAKLDTQEVITLKVIWGKLGLVGKKEWDLDKDPCSSEGSWRPVHCECSFESSTTCRVTGLDLSSYNFSTTLPLEFTNLRHLKILDLSRNYLSGTIPLEWATMILSNVTFMSNRLSGPFPTALTRMTTLLELRISDNNFTGKIPNYVSHWTNIKTLHIQGCYFEGPFPSSIMSLTTLIDLRISDLKGGPSTFPSLENLTTLNVLVLRNCLIYGPIPNYVGNLSNLFALDLSFNNLTGEIPSSFFQLENAEYIYLTENNLTGTMPGWVLSNTKNVDVSYNHFTWDDASGPKKCDQETINVVESYTSSTNKQNNIHPCLRKDFPCTKLNTQQIYSLHINCGGDDININRTIKYEADTRRKGASSYYNGGNWAYSSTGNFIYDVSNVYILSNTSNLHNISTSDIELYTKARTSAISLTYYGLCLMNGNYTVKLHFAEIVFNQDNSSNILGRRVFNVYVQGELKLKDFDIVKEAGGTGRAVIKSYRVDVKNNTLKIRLFWAGKGTNGYPIRGSYGPIISAISVDPNFKPPNFGKKINVRLIVGTVGGGLFLVFLVILILWRKGYILGEKIEDRELTCMDLQTGIFTLRQIKAATKNFDSSNKLGEGGFGVVYKGQLSDGTVIAVKQLSTMSKQGAREFVNEFGMISALQHPNLVRIYGCCVEGNQMSLVYEYMENNCLSNVLLGEDKVSKARLTWPVRVKICLGVARGLAYLHEESHVRIIHRDIKASNVLLDADFNAKISDFGLARLNDDGITQITRVAGTIGYMAPEYAMRGYLSSKADVYSFGIVVLEIVSGKSNNYKPSEECFYLLDWVYVLGTKGKLLEFVDPDLGSEYSSEEALTVLKVAILCTGSSPVVRPSMSQTVDLLEGKIDFPDLRTERGFITADSRKVAYRSHFWQDISETRTDDTYSGSFFTESSVSEISKE